MEADLVQFKKETIQYTEIQKFHSEFSTYFLFKGIN